MDLKEILDKHSKWLNSELSGERAVLCAADLPDAYLHGANLREVAMYKANLRNATMLRADLRNADLRNANLRLANLCGADLRMAILTEADLRGADLRDANLHGAVLDAANLNGANLCGADLSDADLCGAKLYRTSLSGAKGLLDASTYIETTFEHTEDGVIVYKAFNCEYAPPKTWSITFGAVIEEVVNPDRTTDCGSGVNVATLGWVRDNYPKKPIWKCLIRWAWLPGVIVPFATDGKIRASKVELIDIVE